MMSLDKAMKLILVKKVLAGGLNRLGSLKVVFYHGRGFPMLFGRVSPWLGFLILFFLFGKCVMVQSCSSF
jgi:hypothetical protein